MGGPTVADYNSAAWPDFTPPLANIGFAIALSLDHLRSRCTLYIPLAYPNC
jgi:hypothetical protein